MEWRQEQITKRLVEYGSRLGVPAEEMASIKMRPMAIGYSGKLDQFYIGEAPYRAIAEELRGIEARFGEHGGAHTISLDGKSVLAFFEEHESGPEWLVAIKMLRGLIPVLVRAWNALRKNLGKGARREHIQLEWRVTSKKKNGELEETVVTMKGSGSAVTARDFEKLVRLAKKK